MTARIHPLPTRTVAIDSLEMALRSARLAGYETGEYQGFRSGWRWGWVCGAVAGLLVGIGVTVAVLRWERGQDQGAKPIQLLTFNQSERTAS